MNSDMPDLKRTDALRRLTPERHTRSAPRLAAAYFAVAICWLVGGVALGMIMAASEDFLLRPVHAHVNLLGWVTNALFGCFYWLRQRPVTLRDWAGLVSFNIGCLAMLAGLTGLLLSLPMPPFAIPAGGSLVAIAILQMALVIFGSLRQDGCSRTGFEA